MSEPVPVFLLTAIRNEGRLVERLFTEIHGVLSASGLLSRARMVIVDDQSIDETPNVIRECIARHPDLSVELITLASNRGNQSAMAHGLRSIASRARHGVLLTFDADGEDDLTRLPELVEMLERDPSRMVFVYREGRKDGLLVKVFYVVYKLIYRLLTGQRLIPCNLMAVPGAMIPAIAASPLLPLHFSYPPLRLGIPYQALPMARRERYSGRSTQNIGMLIQHALIGLTIFYEQVVARVMLLTGGVVVLTSLLALFIFLVRLLAPQLLPVGLPTLVFLFLFGFGFISVVLLVVFCLATSLFKLLIEQGRRE